MGTVYEYSHNPRIETITKEVYIGTLGSWNYNETMSSKGDRKTHNIPINGATYLTTNGTYTKSSNSYSVNNTIYVSNAYTYLCGSEYLSSQYIKIKLYNNTITMESYYYFSSSVTSYISYNITITAYGAQ